MQRMLAPVLVALLGFGLAQNADQAAPDFTMMDTAGKVVRLSSFRGKPVVVTFWATWCEVCQIEMPRLSARFPGLKNKLVMLAVSRDPSQPGAEVAAFVRAKGWTFSHVLVNPSQGAKNVESIETVTARYRLYGQPWSYFIAPDGTVKAVHPGLMDEAQFGAYLEKIGVK